jgi:zinc protease
VSQNHRVLTLLVVWAMAVHAAGRASPAAAGALSKVRLKNGFRLVVHEDRSLPLVGVCLGVGTGPALEQPAIGGASELIGLTLLDLPESDPRFAEWEKITTLSGAETGVTCEKDTTRITLEIPAELLDRTLATLASLVARYDPDRSKVDELRARLLRDLEEEGEHPESSGLLDRRFDALAYGSHPYARSKMGTRESLKGLTREKLIEHQRRWYVPNDMVLAVAGDVSGERLTPRIQELFGAAEATSLKRDEPEPPLAPDSRRKDEVGLAVPRTIVRVGFLGPALSDPDFHATEVARSLLADGRASRLYRRLAERGGRVTRVKSDLTVLSRAGTVTFDLNLAQPDVWPVVDELLAEVELLRRRPVGGDELERVRNYLTAQHGIELQTRGRLAERLAHFELVDDAFTAESYISEIGRVTADQVQVAARRYLDPARALVCVLRPPGGGPPARPGIGSHRLPNGLTVLTRRRPSAPNLGVCLLVRAGPARERDDQRGITPLLGRLLARGATQKATEDEVALHLESLGSRLRSWAGADFLALSANATAETLDEVLEVIGQIAAQPRFSQADVAQERTRMVVQLREDQANPDTRGVRELNAELWRGHPYSDTQGTPESLGRIRSDDLARFCAQVVQPANAVLVVTGDVDPDKVRELATGALGGWQPAGSSPPARRAGPFVALEGKQAKVKTSDRHADHVFVGFKLSPESRSEFAAITVCLRSLAWGRTSLVDHKLAKIDPTYQPLGLSYRLAADGSLISMGYRVTPGAGKHALAAIEQALAELADKGPSRLDDTRDLIVTLFLKAEQDMISDSANVAIAAGVLSDPQFFEGLHERYRAVTPADVKRAASAHFRSYRAIVFEGRAGEGGARPAASPRPEAATTAGTEP